MKRLDYTTPLENILNFSELLQNKPFLTQGVSVQYRTGVMGAEMQLPLQR